MKKLIALLFLSSIAFADRLGSLKSNADVLLTTQAVSVGGYALQPATVTILANQGLTATSITASSVTVPGTGGITVTQGIAASTMAITQVNTGSVNALTITSTGTGKVLYIVPQGNNGGAYQDQVGAVTIEKLSGVPTEFVVLHDSTTDTQLGTGLFEIWEDAVAHNDPLMWIHNNSNNSNPYLRVDDLAPDSELVCTSTDNAHGLGKWEPASISFQGVDLQINNRAWDNTTFETLGYWHPLSKTDTMPGLYINPQNSVEDVAVVASSDTAGVSFFSLNNRTVGLTAPKLLTNSYNLGLPTLPRFTGQILYNQGNRGGNFGVRQTTWTAEDFYYSMANGIVVSTLTVTSSATFTNVTISGTCTGSGCGSGGGGGSSYALQPATVTVRLDLGMTASTGTFTSSITVTGAGGILTTYGVSGGSLTATGAGDSSIIGTIGVSTYSVAWVFSASSVTADSTITSTQTYVYANCATACTQTLPTAIGVSGRLWGIFMGGAGNVTVATIGSQTFNLGGTTAVMNKTGSELNFVSDGLNWLIN